MTPQRKQRLVFAVLILLGVSMAAGLIMVAVKKNIELFFTPTEIVSGKANTSQNFRVGGMVKVGSRKTLEDGVTVEFELQDLDNAIKVRYTGQLPDLFREGQGIVAKGKLSEDGIMIAKEVLAKHDENYMPPEAAAAMMNKTQSIPTKKNE